MTVLDALYWVACVVLVVAGATKLFEPAATESTMRALGFRVPRNTGRVLGAAEALLGAGGLLAPPGALAQVVAVSVTAAYGGFALVVAGARRRGLQDCGCLGVRSRPPSVGHVVLNSAFAAVAAVSAVLGPSDLQGGLEAVPAGVAVLVGLAVAGTAGLVVARV